MSKYVDYNYLDIYNNKVLGEETVEEKMEEIRNTRKRYRYMVKTIMSGSMLESEIYPVYEKRKDTPRREKDKITKESQDNLNDRNAKRQFVRIVNTNFNENDLVITLTYQDKYLPTQKQAKKDVTNYIRRLKRYRKKNNLPDLKYVYVIEYVDEKDQHRSKKIRVHHHIIINQMDRDAAEDLWKKGRVEARRLQPDEFGLEGLARYMMKQPKGGKRWYGSRNLKKPKVYKSVTRLTKRKAERMAREQYNHSDLFESMYQGRYKYNDCSTYYSDITGGFYLYCRMRKRI